MYESGIKFVNLLMKLKPFQNLELDEEDQFGGGDLAPIDDDDAPLALSMQQTEGQKDGNFKINEFKKALFDHGEGSMLQLMMASDK